MQNLLEEDLRKQRWLERALLEDNPPSADLDSSDMRARILIASVAYFPGAVNRLVQYLQNDALTEVFEKEAKPVATAIKSLRRIYTEAIESNMARDFALQRALQTTIELLPKLSDQG